MNDVFHYPPDLFELLVQTIPLLNKGKKTLLLFFKGAGIAEELYSDLNQKVILDKNNISKFEIARTILERINISSEKFLRERREIIKRVTTFESFDACWPEDQLKAKGLVSEVQKLVNIKDSFTRINQERINEQKKKSEDYLNQTQAVENLKSDREEIKKDLFSLFSEVNKQKRGKLLESVLNRFFKTYQVLVQENFTRIGEHGEGILEQIDGIIEMDSKLFFVEMKWTQNPISHSDVNTHLRRIFTRPNAHGIIISSAGYTPSGIEAAKEGLIQKALLILFDLEEFVKIIDSEIDFKKYLKDKIDSTIKNKNPFIKLI